MYDRILVPTDGSDGVERAIDEAVGLATAVGATIHALYVVDQRGYSTLPDTKWLTIEEALEHEGEAAVATVAERAADAGVDAETTVADGIPHRTILEYAADHDVDVIVMGTHGRSGLEHFLIGSVTEKVIRSADIPVLVVRLQGDDETGGETNG